MQSKSRDFHDIHRVVLAACCSSEIPYGKKKLYDNVMSLIEWC